MNLKTIQKETRECAFIYICYSVHIYLVHFICVSVCVLCMCIKMKKIPKIPVKSAISHCPVLEAKDVIGGSKK